MNNDTTESAFPNIDESIAPNGDITGYRHCGLTIRQYAFLKFAAALASGDWTFRTDDMDTDAVKIIIESADRLADAAMEKLGLAPEKESPPARSRITERRSARTRPSERPCLSGSSPSTTRDGRV